MKIVCGTEEIADIDKLKHRANQAAPPVVTDSPIQRAVDHAVAWSYTLAKIPQRVKTPGGECDNEHRVPPSSRKLKKLIHIVRAEPASASDFDQLFYGVQPDKLLHHASTSQP